MTNPSLNDLAHAIASAVQAQEEGMITWPDIRDDAREHVLAYFLGNASSLPLDPPPLSDLGHAWLTSLPNEKLMAVLNLVSEAMIAQHRFDREVWAHFDSNKVPPALEAHVDAAQSRLCDGSMDPRYAA